MKIDVFEMDGHLRIGFGSDPSHLTAGLERIGTVRDTVPVARTTGSVGA